MATRQSAKAKQEGTLIVVEGIDGSGKSTPAPSVGQMASRQGTARFHHGMEFIRRGQGNHFQGKEKSSSHAYDF